MKLNYFILFLICASLVSASTPPYPLPSHTYSWDFTSTNSLEGLTGKHKQNINLRNK